MPAKKASKKVDKTAVKSTAKKPPPVPSVDWGHAGSQLTKDEAIRVFVNGMNAENRRLVVRADEAPNPYYLRRPTGIIDLDIDIGGGWPAGGCCMVSGPDNAGKTWLVLKTMAYQQKLHGSSCRLAYAVTEGSFPFDQAINAGMKVKVPDDMIEQWQEWRRLRNIPLFTNEEIQAQFKQEVGEVYILRGYTGEELLQVIIEAVRTNGFSCVACDSIAGLAPAGDSAKVMDERDQMSAQALMMTKFFRKYSPITTGINGTNLTTLLFTQQVRANMERSNAPSNMQKYLKLWAITGAWSSKHFKLIDLIVWNGKTLRRGGEESEGKEAIGKMLKWEVEKGKAGTHDNKGGEAAFYYGLHGTDDTGELIASGIRRGVIQPLSRGVVVVRPDTGEVLNDFKAPSQKALRRMIELDFDFELALRREVLTAANIQCLYR